MATQEIRGVGAFGISKQMGKFPLFFHCSGKTPCSSLFWNQWESKSKAATYCISFVAQGFEDLETRVIFGDEETSLKFEVAGGMSSLASLTLKSSDSDATQVLITKLGLCH